VPGTSLDLSLLELGNFTPLEIAAIERVRKDVADLRGRLVFAETLTARGYTVSASASVGGTAMANVTQAEAGATVLLMSTPNDGYRFTGWQVTSGAVSVSDNSFTMPASNVSVRASFEQLPTFAVNYNLASNSGTGTGTTPTESPKANGASFNAATSTGITAPPGKHLASWNTSAAGTGMSYEVGGVILMPGASLTLYAIWEDGVGGGVSAPTTAVGGDASIHIHLRIGANTYSVNGEERPIDVAPRIVEGRTMVPLRFIAEALGAVVGWDAESSTASVELDGVAVATKIGELAPGMDVPAMILNERTLVPLRFISETLGSDVVWNPADSTISITR